MLSNNGSLPKLRPSPGPFESVKGRTNDVRSSVNSTKNIVKKTFYKKKSCQNIIEKYRSFGIKEMSGNQDQSS